MKSLNRAARRQQTRLESLAHVSTAGVSVAVLKRRVPEMVGLGRVNLPEILFTDPELAEQLGRSWRHELQHARDVLDGIDLPMEEMERRARKAEVMT